MVRWRQVADRLLAWWQAHGEQDGAFYTQYDFFGDRSGKLPPENLSKQRDSAP